MFGTSVQLRSRRAARDDPMAEAALARRLAAGLGTGDYFGQAALSAAIA